MKKLFIFFTVLYVLPCNSQKLKSLEERARAFIIATIANRNVYKTKANLKIKKIYANGNPTIDLRDFSIIPNDFPIVTKTTTIVTTEPPVSPAVFSVQTTVTTSVDIPGNKTTITTTTSEVAAQSNKTVVSNTTFTNPAAVTTQNFIRYKVVSDEGDFKYIKILPGCHFQGTEPSDTNIIFGNTANTDEPEDYIFQVSKKDLVPNTHYLASSALIGKTITIPARIRNEYWNENNKILQGTLSIGYGFGWKYRLGNNPYQSHYLSTILYAAGISAQKYYSIGKIDSVTGKPSISAKSDEFAITYLSFGLAYEYENFNIGIFFGKDKMFGNLKDWAYQDKWWWGIGIGYDLFK